MNVTNQGIEKVNQYLKWTQIELDFHSPLIYFGRLLWNGLGQINKALNYFQILSKTILNNHSDLPFLYTELGNIYHEIGQYDLAKENYQNALNIHEKNIPIDYIRIASSLNNIGIVYHQQGQINQAFEYYQQSLDLFNQYYPNNDNIIQKSNTLSNLGSIYRDKGDLDKSLELLKNSLNIRENLLPNDHPLIADSLSNIGSIYYDKSDFEQAHLYYKKALNIQEIICPDNHLKKAKTIRNIAIIYRDENNWNQALNYFNQALQMRIKILSEKNHPDISICLGDIGYIYENIGEINLAIDYYTRQLNMDEKCLPFDHPLLLLHFHLLLNILKTNNQLDKSIELCQNKLKYLENLLDNQYKTNLCYNHILMLYAYLIEDTDHNQAEIYYQQALVIFEQEKDRQLIEKCFKNILKFYSKLNIYDKLLKYQFLYLDFQHSNSSLIDQKQLANTLKDIALLYQLNNQITSAISYYQQSLEIFQRFFQSEHQQIQNIQNKILLLNQDNSSLNNQELLTFKFENDDYKNKPTITYSYAAKPSIRPATSACCILF